MQVKVAVDDKPSLKSLTDDYRFFIKYLEIKNLIQKDSLLPYWGNFPSCHVHLKTIYNNVEPQMKFLDLGCGTGQILRFAKNLGAQVTGIDFEPNFFELLSEYDCDCADIRCLPNSFYRCFDFIYMYRPIKDGFYEYVCHVGSNMKLGALLFTPYDKYLPKGFVRTENSYLIRKISK